MCPDVMHRFFTNVGGCSSKITAIFTESTINPCLHTTCPSSIPKGAQKIHFFIFNDI
jgi:hypothetical protein